MFINKYIRRFIEHGAIIDKVDNYGMTPLFNACSSGNEDIVKYLVKLGADINKEKKINHYYLKHI